MYNTSDSPTNLVNAFFSDLTRYHRCSLSVSSESSPCFFVVKRFVKGVSRQPFPFAFLFWF